MQIALIHGYRAQREVLRRALQAKLHEVITDFDCVEDLMMSLMQYDVLIVYKDLGHHMNGVDGVRAIRKKLPDAVIIGVSSTPNTNRLFLPAGADAFLLRSGNEVSELASLVRKQVALKLAFQ